MLTIKVLGPGCHNCQVLAQKAKEALELLADGRSDEVEATIVKVTSQQQIMQYPIMYTPGLVINEKVVSAGRIPTRDEIKVWLAEALSAPAS